MSNRVKQRAGRRRPCIAALCVGLGSLALLAGAGCVCSPIASAFVAEGVVVGAGDLEPITSINACFVMDDGEQFSEWGFPPPDEESGAFAVGVSYDITEVCFPALLVAAVTPADPPPPASVRLTFMGGENRRTVLVDIMDDMIESQDGGAIMHVDVGEIDLSAEEEAAG